MQTPHRSAELSVDASSLAVSCGSRGVSRDIGPASLFGTRDSARCALSAATTGIAPRPREASRRYPGSRQTPDKLSGSAIDSAPPRQSPGLGGIAPIRALPRMWRAVPCDASTACAAAVAARHWVVTSIPVTPSRRASCPATSPKGDRVMRGIIAALHHAIISFFLTESLAATGPNAALRPVTTGNPVVTGRRYAAGASSGPPVRTREGRCYGSSFDWNPKQSLRCTERPSPFLFLLCFSLPAAPRTHLPPSVGTPLSTFADHSAHLGLEELEGGRHARTGANATASHRRATRLEQELQKPELLSERSTACATTAT